MVDQAQVDSAPVRAARPMSTARRLQAILGRDWKIAILFILPTNPNGVPWHPDKFKWTLFNYAPLAVGGTMLLVGGWWVLSANKWFKGPIAQGTEEELARIEAQYEGRGAHGAAATSA